MPRIVVNPGEEIARTTRQLRDRDIVDRDITFDDRGVSEQDLDDDVAEQFVEEYETIELESDVDDSEIDEIAELLAGTVDEIREEVESGAYDDRLDDVAQREREGDERTTVFGAVERRRNELESDDDGDQDTGGEGGE